MKPLFLISLPLVCFLACGDEEKTDDTSGSNDTGIEDTGSNDTGIEDTGSLGTDNDGDGVTVEDGDCNDEDASIYPGAPEDYTDGIDQDCDGYADVGDANCDAQFTIVFEGADADADGTADSSEEVNLDFCRKWSMTNTYEYDPDTPPELNSISLDLNATDDDDFQCQLRIDQSGVCGAGYYRMGVETGTTYYVSMDCSGVSDENEAEFTFADGYLRLDTIDTGTESGSFSGDPLKTEIAGHLHVWGEDIDIAGSISLSSEQLAGDDEENTCSVLSDTDIDSDQDGFLKEYYDGDDCNDGNSNTYVGAAPNDDPLLCLQDNDGDDWGSIESGGTDCNDENDEQPNNDSDCDGSLSSDDCDDINPNIFPEAEDIPDDNLDQDCDGIDASIIGNWNFVRYPLSYSNCEHFDFSVVSITSNDTITFDMFISSNSNNLTEDQQTSCSWNSAATFQCDQINADFSLFNTTWDTVITIDGIINEGKLWLEKSFALQSCNTPANCTLAFGVNYMVFMQNQCNYSLSEFTQE